MVVVAVEVDDYHWPFLQEWVSAPLKILNIIIVILIHVCSLTQTISKIIKSVIKLLSQLAYYCIRCIQTDVYTYKNGYEYY